MAVIPKAGEVFHSDDGTVSVILPDACDVDAEPTAEELREYAEWLGVDVAREPQLLAVAREGLRTPLPAEWKACRTGDGEVYYFNFLTGESSWDHPLDDVFKRRVAEERAKMGGGAKGRRGRAVEKGAGGNVESPKKMAKVKGEARLQSTASTASSSPTKTTLTPRGLPLSSVGFGRLGALGTPEATQRVTPDVSGLLTASKKSYNNNNSSALTGTIATIGGGVGGLGGIGSITSGMMSLTRPPDGVKEVEAQISRRIEEEIDNRRRAMRLRHEKKLAEERTEMAEALHKIEEDGERQIEVEKEKRKDEMKQRTRAQFDAAKQALEREQVKTKQRVASLLETVKQEEATMEKALQESVENAKKNMELSHEGSLRKQRDEMAATLSREKTRLLESHARQMETVRQNSARDIQTSVDEFKKALETERVKLEKELDDKDKEAGQKTASVNAAVELEAQRAYEAAVQKATVDANNAMEALRQEYRTKEEQLQTAKQKLIEEISNKKNSAAAKSTNSNDDAIIQQEGERLEKALKEKISRYEAETERLVAARKTEVNKAKALQTAAESKCSSPVTTAVQEKRRFELASRSLETKHNQSMDRIRSEHEKVLQEKNLTDPRKTPGYKLKVLEQQKIWLKEHPATVLTMPKLEPVPTLHGLMSSPAVPPPTPEEQRKYIETVVMDTRKKKLVENEKMLAEMEAMLRNEVNNAGTTYREKRLQEIQAQLTQYRERQTEEHQKRLDELSVSIAEEAKRRAVQQSSDMSKTEITTANTTTTTAPPAATPTPTVNSKGDLNLPLLKINEVTVEEMNRQEKELRRRSLARIERLQEMIRQARAVLQQRQEDFQMKNDPQTTMNKSSNNTDTNITAPGRLQRPPPVPKEIFLPGRMEPPPPPLQQQTLHPQPQQLLHGFSTPILNRSVSTIPPVNTVWSSAMPSPTRAMSGMHTVIAPSSSAALSYEKQVPLADGGSSGNRPTPYLLSQNNIIEDRLQRASLLLKERKRKLREAQNTMERVREVWRRDMEDCRSRSDRNQALMLREIKVALEEKATQLNREVVDMKKAAAWLRGCMERHKLTLNQQNMQFGSLDDMNAASVVGAPGVTTDGTRTTADSGRVLSLLEDLLAQTKVLRSYMKSTKKTHEKSSHHHHHHNRQRRRSPLAGKRHSNRHVGCDGDVTLPQSNSALSDVTRWLVEQQLCP